MAKGLAHWCMEATLTAGLTDLARRIDPVGTKVKYVPGYKPGLQFEKA